MTNETAHWIFGNLPTWIAAVGAVVAAVGAIISAVAALLTWAVYTRIAALAATQNSINNELLREARRNREESASPQLMLRLHGHTNGPRAEVRLEIEGGHAFDIHFEPTPEGPPVIPFLAPWEHGRVAYFPLPIDRTYETDEQVFAVLTVRATYRDIFKNRFETLFQGGACTQIELGRADGSVSATGPAR